MSSSGPTIESRACSAFDIPIESRTCSAYDIPIPKKSNTTTSVATSDNDENRSSVIDKSEIAARGIQQGITRHQIDEEIQSFIHAPLTLRNEQRSFLTIVMFLTRLPVPTTVDLHPGFLMKGMCYFPAVGMLIGMAVAATFDLIAETAHLPPVIAAAVSIGTGWVITGCLHEDGLSDSVDGES
jgi:Cobalamin-5-phosphate synthase